MAELKPPRKRWRVYDRNDIAGPHNPVDCTSEQAAFLDAARAINGNGHEAWIYHWERRHWVLFEKCPADTAWGA